MCYIPRNLHHNAVVYDATVRMVDGSTKKWRLSRLDAGHLLVVWRNLFDRVFDGVDLNLVDTIKCISRFSSDDDFTLKSGCTMLS